MATGCMCNSRTGSVVLYGIVRGPQFFALTCGVGGAVRCRAVFVRSRIIARRMERPPPRIFLWAVRITTRGR